MTSAAQVLAVNSNGLDDGSDVPIDHRELPNLHTLPCDFTKMIATATTDAAPVPTAT